MHKFCTVLSTALHVLTLVLTIRAVMPVPEAKPKVKHVPCPQEAVFNSYDTSSN